MEENQKPKSLGQKMVEEWSNVEGKRNEDLRTFLKLFDDFKNGRMPKKDFVILIGVYCSRGVPLPSGRYGTVLALALEMKELDIARDIVSIKGVATDIIASRFGGGERMSLTDYINEQRASCDESDRKILDEITARAKEVKEDVDGEGTSKESRQR